MPGMRIPCRRYRYVHGRFLLVQKRPGTGRQHNKKRRVQQGQEKGRYLKSKYITKQGGYLYIRPERSRMDQEGLLFPKEQSKKKRKKHRKSIISGNRKGVCYLCGRYGFTHEHHIFGGANRDNSEEYGLKVHLCVECHETGKEAVHICEETRRKLERLGQYEFERQIGSRTMFIRIFGRNCL